MALEEWLDEDQSLTSEERERPKGSSGIALQPDRPEALVDSRSIINPDGL